MGLKWFDNTPRTKTIFTANLPDYEAMSPFERRSIEVLGKKGMLPPVTTTASEVPISKLAGWKGGVLQYGANIGGSIAGKKMSEALGASETASDIIGTTTGLGAGLLATRLATGSFGGPIGITTAVALSALPFIISAFSDDEEPASKPDRKTVTTALAEKNPAKPQEDIATEIDLLDQMAKKTKSDYEKAIAPINALASGYTDPMNPKGIDFSRVEKNVKALGDAALSYSAGKALGALYVQAGLQGALDMVDKNSLLSADTFNKMKQMTSAMISAKKGNREAAGALRQMMGDLEAIGLKNRDVISAVGMAADMNVKLADQLNDLAIAKQRVQSKTVTLDGKGKAPNLSYLNMVQDNLISQKKDALELGDQKAAKIAQDKLDQLSNYISSNYPGLQLSSGSSSGKKISMADL